MSSVSKNFVYNTALSLSQLIIPVFTFPYITRILGPDGIGRVNFADSFVGYFILFAGLGIPIYGVREIARADKSQVAEVFSEIFSIQLLFTILLSALYLLITFLFFSGETLQQYLVVGGVMLISTTFIVEWYFQGTAQFRFIAVRTILNRLFFFALLFILIHNKSHAIYYFLMIVLSTAVNAVVNFYIVRKEVQIKVQFSSSVVKKHFLPIFYIFFSRAAITLFLFLDTIFLGFLSDDEQVGYFSTALKITKIPIMIVSSLGVVLMPNLSGAFADKNLNHFRELIKKSISFVLATSIPIVFLFYSCSDYIITVFAGSKYTQASILIKILSPVIILIGLSTIFSQQILIPMKKDKQIMISVIGAIIACVFFDIYLISKFKAIGAAITNLIVESIVMLVCLFFALKSLVDFIDVKQILTYLVFAIPSVFFVNVSQMLSREPLIVLLITMAFFGIYYLITYGFILKNEIFVLVQRKIKKSL
ncbi:hypothetical protein ASG01_10230 [Chryseobacterium sp. Leaf180]|uniref:flippase n=1 Tax=Chryseobacterium sp. Leaf180 TaxID=1736289 RepID=UPI0007008EE6|nr:flippase [Chryseobacterium sp. Leaf180]KQR93541.1 hypothetical protein ASG01_10230 [Chryseobacterium sp. Leaf180]